MPSAQPERFASPWETRGPRGGRYAPGGPKGVCIVGDDDVAEPGGLGRRPYGVRDDSDGPGVADQLYLAPLGPCRRATSARSSSHSAGESCWAPLHTAPRSSGMTPVPMHPRAHPRTCSGRPRREERCVPTQRAAPAVIRRSRSIFASLAALGRIQTWLLPQDTSAPKHPSCQKVHMRAPGNKLQ